MKVIFIADYSEIQPLKIGKCDTLRIFGFYQLQVRKCFEQKFYLNFASGYFSLNRHL